MTELGLRDEVSTARTTLTSIGVVVCGVFPVLLTGAMVAQMQPDLRFTASGLGLATAGFFATGAVGSVFLGQLVDTLGSRRGLRMAALLAAVSLLGIGVLAQSLLHLTFFLAVGGTANTIAHPAANRALLRRVAGRQGLAFGLKQAAIPMGSLLGGVSVPVIALTVGWRWAFVGAGVFALGMALAVPRSVTKISRRAGPGGRGRGPVRPGRPLMVIALAAGCGALASNSVGAFLTLSNVEAGLPEASAGVLLSVSSLGGVLVRVGVGWAADHRPGVPRYGVPALLLLGAIGMVALTVPALPTLIVGSLLAFAAGWGWPGLLNLLVSRAHPESPAAATGIGLSGVYVGAAVGPLAFGVLADTYSLSLAWAVAASTMVLGAVLMLIGSRLLGPAPERGSGVPVLCSPDSM